ncbi:MAG: efflux RND transporter periplasmic adaptor subunit [Cyclobacteriaceae bacterium]|nr:efflux RND transporter periplasmic adaptor subunit [Cyclobacteriaceae bacterium]
MKKVFGILMIVILVASFIGVGYILIKKSMKSPVVYESEKMFYTDIVKKTVATGTITPRKEVALKSQVSGVVEKLYVEAGEIVKQNDVIAKIKIIPDVVMLNNAEMRLKTAIINFKNAQIEMDRQKKLFKESVISDLDYNTYLLEYQLRSQEVEAAENNLELVKEGASKKAGTVSNLVRATAEGMVLDVPVKEGTFVIESNTFNEGTTIASIADMNDIIFEGKVDESEVGKIKEGMNLDLKIGALQDEDIKASLEYISPKGVEKDGAIQFEIKAAVKLKEGTFLRAGYSANADIVLEKRDSVMAVKESNVLFEDDKTFVEVETGDQQYEKTEIKTGLSDGINLEVLSGVSDDQKVKLMK